MIVLAKLRFQNAFRPQKNEKAVFKVLRFEEQFLKDLFS